MWSKTCIINEAVFWCGCARYFEFLSVSSNSTCQGLLIIHASPALANVCPRFSNIFTFTAQDTTRVLTDSWECRQKMFVWIFKSSMGKWNSSNHFLIATANSGTKHLLAAFALHQMTIHTGIIDSGYKTKRKSCIKQGSLGIFTWIPPVTPHCKFFIRKEGFPFKLDIHINIFFLPTTVTVGTLQQWTLLNSGRSSTADTPQQQTLLNSRHQWYNRQFWKFWLSF